MQNLALRQQFIDRHVIYEGRHISTQLLTSLLENYSRPRPMQPEERDAFLERIFRQSGW
jgi:poly-gamma-glutamate synthesis protein (capsule biosynthesis protein)